MKDSLLEKFKMKNIDILDKGDSLITQMLLNGNLSIDDVLTLFHNQHK